MSTRLEARLHSRANQPEGLGDATVPAPSARLPWKGFRVLGSGFRVFRVEGLGV